MNKKIVLLFIACVLFAAAFAHHDKDKKKVTPFLNRSWKTGKQFSNGFEEHRFRKILKIATKGNSKHVNNLSPDVVFEKTVSWGEYFSIDVPKGDSLAIQVVRASDAYTYEDGQSHRLSLCRYVNSSKTKCVNDETDNTLSFEVDAKTLQSISRKNRYEFTLATSGSKLFAGAVVYIYACVGENASLATCRTNTTVDCVNGKPSDVIDCCICDKGYTGRTCARVAPKSNNWENDSEFEQIGEAIMALLGIIINIGFFITFVVLICCCVCVRGFCRRRRMANRGRVVSNVTPGRPQQVPPPPPYFTGYHPLSVVPPPPPPPMPVPISQPRPAPSYDPYASAEGIELATIPARNSGAVYIMPPLAPVKQVPVFVQPPSAPKN